MNDKLKQFYKDNQEQFSLSSKSKERTKQRIFAKLSEPRPESKNSFWLIIRTFSLKTYVAVPLVVLLFIFGTTVVSANSVPGDLLYPVKRKVETARVLFAPTQESKLNLQINFAEKRSRELEKIKEIKPVETRDIKNNDQVEQDNNNRRNNNRRVEVRQEAQRALEFLENNRERVKERGDEKKIERVNRTIDNLRDRLEDSSNSRSRDGETKRDGNDSQDNEGPDDSQNNQDNSR